MVLRTFSASATLASTRVAIKHLPSGRRAIVTLRADTRTARPCPRWSSCTLASVSSACSVTLRQHPGRDQQVIRRATAVGLVGRSGRGIGLGGQALRMLSRKLAALAKVRARRTFMEGSASPVYGTHLPPPASLAAPLSLVRLQ